MKTRLSFKALTCFLMLFSAQVLFAAEYIITKSELIAKAKKVAILQFRDFTSSVKMVQPMYQHESGLMV